MDIIKFDVFKKMVADKKIFLVLLVVFITGVLLMILSEGKAPEDAPELKTQPKEFEINESAAILENNLEKLLSKVDGFGETHVMIRFNSTSEKIPLTTKSISTEKIIQSNSGGETIPFISKEIYAPIEGIIIVAQGGDNEKTSSEVCMAVSEMLGIPIHKVNILKMNDGGK